MLLEETLHKLFFVKRWRAWPYREAPFEKVQYYTVECRIDKTLHTPEMIYRARIDPIQLSMGIGSDDLTYLKPLFREMSARMDKGLEEYLARL